MKKRWCKAAQGLSLNVIIIAVIALVVLVVVIAIFSQSSGKSINTITSCAGRGGDCKPACETGEINVDATCSENTICCLKLIKDES